MSADNGIYVLKTKVDKFWVREAPELFEDRGPGRFEYRVAHAMAVENICYNMKTGDYQKDFIPEIVFDYFGDCRVFIDEGEALKYAHELEKEYDILEYGVSILDHSHQVFPSNLTKDDVERYEVEMDKEANRHRAEREQERQEWVANNQVGLTPLADGCLRAPGGGEFVPRVMYGDLMVAPGKTLRGRVTVGDRGECTFLPEREQ